MRHRRDIQGLRAVAVLLVVLAHAGVPALAGGWVGVDVFYVLSGYLITGLLLGERESTGTIRLAAFYARRLKRLLPALLLMLAATMAAAVWLLAPAELGAQTASARYAATWTSNLYFAFAQVDYFAELQTRDLFLHTWSLGVEEQFYLIWPLLLLLMTRAAGLPGEQRGRLRLSLAAVLVAGLVLYGVGSAIDPARTFYMMPARIWQFALGALVCVGTDSANATGARWAQAAGGLGIALIVGAALALDANTGSGWIVVPSLGAALVIAAGRGPSAVARWLAHPVLVWIGDRSYSWYLWHWPVLLLGATVGFTGPAGVAGLCIASLALASLSYGLAERPLWKGAWTASLPPRLVNLTAVLLMAVAVAGAMRAPETAEPEVYGNCDDWFRSDRVVPCEFGPAEAPRTVVLVGDSVGAQWLPMVREALPAPAWRTVLLMKSACPIVDQDFVYDRIGAVYRVCRTWRDAVLDHLDAEKPDLAIIGSAAHYPFSHEQWVSGSGRVLARLAVSARHTIVMAGTPVVSFHGPTCLEQNRRAEGQGLGVARSCGEPWNGGGASDVAGYLREAAGPYATASVLDLNDRVCPSHWCGAQTPDGMVVFRDSRHLTGDFSRAQAPALLAHLRSLGVALEPEAGAD